MILNNIYFVVNVIEGKYKYVNRNSVINYEKEMVMLMLLWVLFDFIIWLVLCVSGKDKLNCVM